MNRISFCLEEFKFLLDMMRREKATKKFLGTIDEYIKAIRLGFFRDVTCYLVESTSSFGLYQELCSFEENDIPKYGSVALAKLDANGELNILIPKYISEYENIGKICSNWYSTPDKINIIDIYKIICAFPKYLDILSDDTLFNIRYLSDTVHDFCNNLFKDSYITKLKHLDRFLSSEGSEVSPPWRGAHITGFECEQNYYFMDNTTSERGFCRGTHPKDGTFATSFKIAGEYLWANATYRVKAWTIINGEKYNKSFIFNIGFPRLFEQR